MKATFVGALAIAGVFSLTCTPLVAATGSVPKGAKAIFDSGEGSSIAMASNSAPAARVAEPRQGYVGISYQIMQVSDDGRLVAVSRSRVFRNGERVKLFVRTNRPGYLTVMNIGPTGNTNVLFNEFVEPFRPIDVPRGTNLRFVGDAGNERLLFMLSNAPNPLGVGGQQPGMAPAAPMPADLPGGAPGYAPPPATAYAPPPAPGYAPPPMAGTQPGTMPPPTTAYAPPAYPAPTGDLPQGAPIVASIDGAKAMAMRGAKDIVVEDGMQSSFTVLSSRESYRPRQSGMKDLVVESQGGVNYGVIPVSAMGDGGILTLQVNLRHD